MHEDIQGKERLDDQRLGHGTDVAQLAMPSEPQVEVASDLFRLLADPTRVKLLCALLQGESSVSRLAELVGASPTAVSQHLSKLRWSKLVRVRRQGTFAYYSAADDHVARLLLEALSHAARPVMTEIPDPDPDPGAVPGPGPGTGRPGRHLSLSRPSPSPREAVSP